MQRAFIADAQRRARVAAALGAKRKYPDHWSGKNARDRACSTGDERLYVEVYALLSWYVHAGSAGTAGMGKDGFEAVFGICHALIRRVFLDAVAICAKATKISALPEFPGWMTSLETKTAELIVAAQVRAQSTPP